MERVVLGCLAALVVIGLAGCGGGRHGYTLAPTQSCLKKAGYDAATAPNRFLPGAGGNLRVRLTKTQQLLNPNQVRGRVAPNTYVFLVFAKDAAAALATEEKALTLALRSLRSSGLLVTRATAKKAMQVTENVFFYSPTGALTQGERSKVTSCLR